MDRNHAVLDIYVYIYRFLSYLLLLYFLKDSLLCSDLSHLVSIKEESYSAHQAFDIVFLLSFVCRCALPVASITPVVLPVYKIIIHISGS